jgi:hypothetical protein
MEWLFDISQWVLICGLIGYVWQLRRTIAAMIPGQFDDRLLDMIEGLANTFGVDLDAAAMNSVGKLREEVHRKSAPEKAEE